MISLTQNSLTKFWLYSLNVALILSQVGPSKALQLHTKALLASCTWTVWVHHTDILPLISEFVQTQLFFISHFVHLRRTHLQTNKNTLWLYFAKIVRYLYSSGESVLPCWWWCCQRYTYPPSPGSIWYGWWPGLPHHILGRAQMAKPPPIHTHTLSHNL